MIMRCLSNMQWRALMRFRIVDVNLKDISFGNKSGLGLNEQTSFLTQFVIVFVHPLDKIAVIVDGDLYIQPSHAAKFHQALSVSVEPTV